MTTTTTYTIAGDDIELKTNPGCAPMVFRNGVLQDPSTYRINGKSIIFDPINSNPWTRWFAWRPVRVNGSWQWCKQVYRRPLSKTYATMDDWTQYEYGSLFDVLADSH